MNYRVRIGGALAVSLVLNLALLAVLPRLAPRGIAIAHTRPLDPAFRVDLRPSQPRREPERAETPRQIVEAGAAAQQPVAETDLISSAETQAQDQSDAAGDPSKPAVDEVDEFDQLGASATPPPAFESPPVIEAPAIPSAGPTAAEARPASPAAPARVANAESGSLSARSATTESGPAPAREDQPDVSAAASPPEALPDALPERFQVAAATPPASQVPVQELEATRGREQGGATHSGFTSFEANKHELGEYMLHVRNLVELEWRTALRVKYAGVSRTYAIIECSIRPDGTLEFARVLEPGSSLTYAVMCRQAIEQAAPFGAFPFDVPEIYRNENLEITWKFSYL
jgi:hypothetical protein